MTETSSNTPAHLAVFTRYPEPGTTKTRMIPALGAAGAADLQREMTRHTLGWARRLASSGSVAPNVYFEGGSQTLMGDTFGEDLTYVPQPTGDLGSRLSQVFRQSFAAGAAKSVIVGSDCPGLGANLVQQAIDHLSEVDLVLGPATDGGYTLIALRRESPELFDDMPWGSDRVLDITRRKADALGLSVALLPPLDDVDRPEDLHVWTDALQARAERISVIVPTLHEHPDQLDDVLRSTQAPEADVETILVGADDHAADFATAKSLGVRVLRAPRGRASQMNAGARAADGGILLFLHADTRLPHGFPQHVRRVLANPNIAMGAFQLAVDSPDRSLRLIEQGVHLRSRWLQRPYGDQAFFLRAGAFDKVGHFADMPILEDVDLVRRMRKLGRVAIAPAAVVTSARRWKALGVWRTAWVNQVVLAGHKLGVSPRRLAQWYYRKDNPRRPRAGGY